MKRSNNGTRCSPTLAALLALFICVVVAADTTFPFVAPTVRIFSMAEKVVEESWKIFRTGGPRGYRALMEHIGSLRLGNKETAELLVRVAAKDGRISVKEAETLYSSLGEVPGFTKTAKWLLVGEKSSAQLIGSLQELRIASSMQKGGYKVVELRALFRDPAKKGMSDIDLVVEKGGKRFAIESKAWAQEAQWDQIVKDAGTLKAYEKLHPGTASYFFFKQPPSPLVERKLKDEGIRYLVVKDPEVLIHVDL